MNSSSTAKRRRLGRVWSRTRWNGRAGGLALIVCSLALLPVPATTTSWIAPSRPLTRGEKLAQSVGWSDAICQAQILELVETSRQIGSGPEPVWVPDVHLVLRPISWLKGSKGRILIRVGVDESNLDRFRRMRDEGFGRRQGVFFLVRAPALTGHPELDDRWPYSPQIQWTMNFGPYAIDDGMLDLPVGDKASTLELVRSEVGNQSIAALTSASDLVAIVHPDSGETVHSESGQTFHLRVHLDNVIAGQAGEGEIIVHSIVPGDLPEGLTLVFLKRSPDGTYRIVTPAAGSRAIRGGRVKKIELPLETVTEGIRAVRKGVVR